MHEGVTRPERTAVSDLIIVDADVHVNDAPQALAPYCALPGANRWKRLPIRRSATSMFPAMRRRSSSTPRFRACTSRAPSIPPPRCATSCRRSPSISRILFPDHCCSSRPCPISSTRPSSAMPTTAGCSSEWLLREPVSTARCWPVPRIRRTRTRDRASGGGGAHRRGLPADGRRQSALGPPQVRPDLCGRGSADLPVCLHSVTMVSPPSRVSSTSSRTISPGRCCPTRLP